MADSFLTLTDLAKINDQNAVDLGVTDLLQDAPLFAALGADFASNGDTHKYIKETGAPVVGFRAVNDGRENSKSADTVVTVTLKVMDGSFKVDQALADIYTKGREAYIAREARRHMRAMFAGAEAQFLYGVGANADGFVGLADNAAFDGLADAMVVNAGGTTVATGSSVWLIRTNDMGTDMQAILGKSGNITMGDTTLVEAKGTTGTYPALYTPITGWLGMQVGSAYSIVRIANLTADANKGLTDALIYEALSRFPASRQPNLIVMNRRSLKQLRASRTATNVTGAPAPRPTEVEGIPIITTDSIKSTEALLT